jgi:hypothetical protein
MYIEISLERISAAAYLTLGSSIGKGRAEHEQRGLLKAGRGGMIFPASFNDFNSTAGGPTSDF